MHHKPRTLQHETHTRLPFSPQALRPTWKWRRKITAVVWLKSVDTFIVSDVKMIFYMCSHHKTIQDTTGNFPMTSQDFWIFLVDFSTSSDPFWPTRGSSPMKPPSPKPTGAPRWSQNPLGPLRQAGFCIGSITIGKSRSKMGKFRSWTIGIQGYHGIPQV